VIGRHVRAILVERFNLREREERWLIFWPKQVEKRVLIDFGDKSSRRGEAGNFVLW
jgi:hypothetical protein